MDFGLGYLMGVGSRTQAIIWVITRNLYTEGGYLYVRILAAFYSIEHAGLGWTFVSSQSY
jgi:hypothetical protein